jgi:hypothetical protein
VGIVRDEGVVTKRTGDAIDFARSARMFGWTSGRDFLVDWKATPCKRYYHDSSDPTDPTDGHGRMPQDWLSNDNNGDNREDSGDSFWADEEFKPVMTWDDINNKTKG